MTYFCAKYKDQLESGFVEGYLNAAGIFYGKRLESVPYVKNIGKIRKKDFGLL
jgi:hypothetical protein